MKVSNSLVGLCVAIGLSSCGKTETSGDDTPKKVEIIQPASASERNSDAVRLVQEDTSRHGVFYGNFQNKAYDSISKIEGHVDGMEIHSVSGFENAKVMVGILDKESMKQIFPTQSGFKSHMASTIESYEGATFVYIEGYEGSINDHTIGIRVEGYSKD